MACWKIPCFSWIFNRKYIFKMVHVPSFSRHIEYYWSMPGFATYLGWYVMWFMIHESHCIVYLMYIIYHLLTCCTTGCPSMYFITSKILIRWSWWCWHGSEFDASKESHSISNFYILLRGSMNRWTLSIAHVHIFLNVRSCWRASFLLK